MNRPPAYPFSLKEVTLYNGCRISYMDEGSGTQTILFIHGLANYGASWKKNMAALSKKYRCIAIDLPGNGLSANLNKYSIKIFADCILDFIGRLNLTNVCLAGHSMGGQIAIRATTEAPGAVRKLLLFAPAGFEEFSEIEKMMYRNSVQYMSWISNDAYNLEQTLKNSFYRFPSAADGMIKDLIALMQRQPTAAYRSMIDQCVQSMIAEPVYAELSFIKQPALVLFGVNDALIPNKILHMVSTKSVAEKGTSKLQNGVLKMIPDCGHFLQWEKATTVNEIIEAWMAAPVNKSATSK